MMVQVGDLDEPGVASVLEARRFRRRPEPWNQQETSYGIAYRKQVSGLAVTKHQPQDLGYQSLRRIDSSPVTGIASSRRSGT